MSQTCTVKDCGEMAIKFYSFICGNNKYIVAKCESHPFSEEQIQTWAMREISEDEFMIKNIMNR